MTVVYVYPDLDKFRGLSVDNAVGTLVCHDLHSLNLHRLLKMMNDFTLISFFTL